MRNVKDLHPKLQPLVEELKALCLKNGIKIGISECLRTTAEQDALYAKGRTAPGKIVTNCKGSTYSSLHQWGVAFDFYLIMDVDGDGSTSDDAFNNSTKLFNKVGALGKSIGLRWGGDFKSIVDTPHFQLPDWGDTATKLKKQYGTPEKFMKTWGKTTSTKTETKEEVKSYSKSEVEPAKFKDKKYNKTFKTTAALRLRSGAGTKKDIIIVIPKGKKVSCFGFYSKADNKPWLFVQYNKYTGFVSLEYLKAVE